MIENHAASRGRIKKDGLYHLKSQQREMMASKMKAEKLKSALAKLKDGERKSKQRNENLLQDFGKVTEMGTSLDRKAEKLKSVKEQYEMYIKAVYPDWKENIEINRMAGSRRATKQVKTQSFTQNPMAAMQHSQLHDEIEDSFAAGYQPNYLQSTTRYADTSRTQNLAHRGTLNHHSWSEEPLKHPQKDFRFHSAVDEPRQRRIIEQDWNDLRIDLDTPDPLSGYATKYAKNDSLYPRGSFTQYHDQSLRMSPRSRQMREEPNPHGANFQQTQPSILDLPEVDRSRDISAFTIIPQALALSPDGKLVLLPMAFSPGIQPTNQAAASRSADVSRDDSSKSMNDILGQPQSRIGATNSERKSSELQLKLVSERLSQENSTPLPENEKKDRYDRPENRFVRQSLKGPSMDFSESKMDESIETEKFFERGKPSLGENAGVYRNGKININGSGFQGMTVDGGTKTNENSEILKSNVVVSEECNDDAFVAKVRHDYDYRQRSIDKEDSDNSVLQSAANSVDAENRKLSQEDDNFESEDLLENQQFVAETEIEMHPPINTFITKTGASDRPFSSSKTSDENTNEVRKRLEEHATPNLNISPEGYSDHKIEIADSAYKAKTADDALDGRVVETSPSRYANTASDSKTETSPARKTTVSGDNISDLQNHAQKSNSFSGDVANQRDMYELESASSENNRHSSVLSLSDSHPRLSQQTLIDDGKYSCLEMNDLSYLLEEIENRMGIVSKTEFYSIEAIESDDIIMKEIHRTVASSGSLDDFETRDLCSLAAIEISERIKGSGHESILKDDTDVRYLKTNNGLRDVLNSGFNDLWDYVFNHMELLIGNNIFGPNIVSEKFATLLAPRSKDMQVVMRKVLRRVLASSEQGSVSSETSESNLDRNTGTSLSQDQQGLKNIENSLPSLKTIDSSIKKETINDQTDREDLAIIANGGRQNEKELKHADDLSLDLGSVSEDDSSSTFDSTQFTARKETKDLLSDSQVIAEDEDKSADAESIKSESLQELPTEKDPIKEEKVDESTENITTQHSDDSDDELDDLLSSSLVFSGNRNSINLQSNNKQQHEKADKEDATQKKSTSSFNALINKADDRALVGNEKNSDDFQRKDVLSPNNSKSISSKFRKPGFWENSDSESEAEELKVSGGHILSDENENDDDFDFDFYN